MWDPIIKGCTTSTACNYNPEAKEDDNSCIDPLGCDNWCPGDTTEVKELDCAGICGGLLFIDCTGECGILVTDECGICGGNNAICTDCNGVVNGEGELDNCLDCVGGDTGLEACTYDCTGIWGGDAELDVCGICGGSNTDISQCNTVCPIGLELGCDKTCHPTGTQPINDECNICDGDNTVCADCLGVPNGDSELDVCGVCGGDGTIASDGYVLLANEFENLCYNIENTDSIHIMSSYYLPPEIGQLTNLVYLRMTGYGVYGMWNDSIFIPENIGYLTNLSYLEIEGYKDVYLPERIGDLSSLEVLQLRDNQLTSLPESICNLPNDCYIIVDNNCLSEEYHYDCIDTWGTQDECPVQDCAGIWGGSAVEDCTGICGGSTTGCSVYDIDGNGYTTVTIGTQEWLVQNLKTTKYQDGSEIPTGYSGGEWGSLSTGAYAIYDDDPANADVFGNLYNWFVVDEGGGVCPEGFHIPSDDEYKELEMFLGMSESEANNTAWRGTNEGSKLAGNSDLWESGNLENNSEFGTSGFTAHPAGFRDSYFYYVMGKYSFFWLSSEGSSSNAMYRQLSHNYSEVWRLASSKQTGFSIRCVGD